MDNPYTANININQILQQTIEITKEVAQFIQSEIGKINQNDIEIKSLNSLVTYVDITSEQMLVEQLQKILPDASFLTEEETINKTQNDWQWIIDPLDGTTNFIHQIPVFAISVALAYKNEIQLGVVLEINKNDCFYATKNNGAYLNGKKISVTQTSKLEDSLIATGFPYYDFNKLEAYIHFLKFLMQKTRGIRRLGAASIDLCYVACGKFDAFFEYSLAPWDVAAGSLIVQEAGGLVYDFSGENNFLYGKEIIACNNNLYNAFINELKKSKLD